LRAALPFISKGVVVEEMGAHPRASLSWRYAEADEYNRQRRSAAMHTSFSSTIAGWQSFYVLAGSASATLIGLIFVAVSLHIDLIGEAGAAAILSLARRTFTRFILIVIVALLFLVPNQVPRGLGLPLLALGVVDVLRTLRVARVVITALKQHPSLQDAVNRIVLPVLLPLVSGIGLIVVAATVLNGMTSYLYWMVPIVALILTSAATNAWDLMLGLARYKLRRAGRIATSGVETSSEEGRDPLSDR
jgi:hypothetical protein